LEIINLAQEELKGYTDVTLEAKIAPLSSINLDLKYLTVDSVKKGNSTLSCSHTGELLNIVVPFSTAGQTETIRVYYHGKPFNETFGGFYFKNDFAYNMGVAINNVPHSFGRVWFPCIDEFTDKSTYTFTITTDIDKKAICGGMLTDSTNLGDKILWKWNLTDPIPTYLASVAVGKYKVYKDTVHSILGVLPIEIYADSATLLKVPDSFVNLKTFIHTYEERWGACRWQRVGYVAVPFHKGAAMEHATNIAYPIASITGSAGNQDLIAHELAHSWFGNLVTCATPQNMWINEGFATYGESLCSEILDPTLETYKKEIKILHSSVLKSSVCGLYALDNVPENETYSSISYDKGALVAYTLRNYMGDNKFFSSITQFLNENQYKNVNSEEFLQKLSVIFGIDLTDFFLGWIHQKGFLNFNIDSITHKGGNKYEIALKQKLYLADYFANSNKVDVEFISNSGEKHLIEKIPFSGEHALVEVEIPFEPVFWCIDPNGKMADACFDNTQSIFKTGSIYLSNAKFRIAVDEISDTSILRVEHNPVAPTPAKNTHPDIVKVSEKHFWRVGFIRDSDLNASYSFYYSKEYDAELLQGYTKNDLLLLYRKDASSDWLILPATVSGSAEDGTMSINSILQGEYAFGIGKNLNIKEFENSIKVYPNPTGRELNVKSNKLQITGIEIYDIYGKKLSNHLTISSSNSSTIDISHLPSGTYILHVITGEAKIYKKIIKL
jgi:aminopeptidase N